MNWDRYTVWAERATFAFWLACTLLLLIFKVLGGSTPDPGLQP